MKRKLQQMPVHKVKGGWRYGHPGHGHKVFKSKADAMRQAKAIAIAKAQGHQHHHHASTKYGVHKKM